MQTLINKIYLFYFLLFIHTFYFLKINLINNNNIYILTEIGLYPSDTVNYISNRVILVIETCYDRDLSLYAITFILIFLISNTLF